MGNMIEVKNVGTVNDLNKRQDLQFISDSQDVNALKEHFGNNEELANFDAFFVKVDNGDYAEIYGIEGIIPNLTKTIWQVGVWENYC